MENPFGGSPLPRPPKRSHSQMSGFGDASRSQSRVPSLALPTQSSRYPGDGLDYRRPATPSRVPSGPSRSSSDTAHNDIEVVDLTNGEEPDVFTPRVPFGQATRGPRFARDIIDLSEDSNPRPSSSRTDVPMTGSSDVQFVSERRLPSPLLPDTLAAGPPAHLLDLTNDDSYLRDSDSDDVQFIRAAQRYPHYSPPLGARGASSSNPFRGFASSIAMSASQLLRSSTSTSTSSLRVRHGIHSPAPRSGRNTTHATNGSSSLGSLINFVAPMLDFDSVGFDMGIEDVPTPPPGRPQRIPPPPRAPAGYTRSPKPDEVYVCPNCDRELRTGETEIQRQIWIVRACGHVYCGECANQRQASKHKKAKQPLSTKPFSHCVETGCEGKTTGAKAMIQIFL